MGEAALENIKFLSDKMNLLKFHNIEGETE